MHEHTSHIRLALQATSHCLLGCGIGDIVGMVVSTAIGIPYLASIIVGVVLGFVFGLLLGIMPLIQASMSYKGAMKIVITTEMFSILAMEAAEATTEVFFPGMRRAGFIHLRYWFGLFASLSAGFVVALPVNLFLVKKGVRHHH